MLQHLTLAFIGITAGAEVKAEELMRDWRKVGWLVLGVSLFSWLFVFAGFMAASPFFTFTQSLSHARLVAMASLTATIMVARSPASCIAVLREVDAHGPFSSLVLAVVVAKDILVVAAFAVNVELCIAMQSNEILTRGPFRVLQPVVTLLVYHITVGVIGGALLVAAMRTASRLPAGFAASGGAIVMTVSLAAFMSCAADKLQLECLLLCLVAGVTAANWPSKPEKSPDLMTATMDNIMPFNNVVFFTLVGASLPLSGLEQQKNFALLLFVCRTCAIYCGSRVGAHFAGCPPEHARSMWCTMLTQAGVALGLTTRLAEHFPEFGDEFTALLTTVICFNQAIGPPIFKSALLKIGECNAAQVLK